MGRLDIRICEARNLPDTQSIGKPDPYCIVRCENQQHKTRVLDNNLNPKWEEVFKFQVADENSAQLRFELWNKNIVSDELLGMYTLSIAGLKKGLVSDQWYLLQKCKGNAELRIRMCALDFGTDPTPAEKAQMAQNGTQVGGAIPATIPAAAPVPTQAPAQQPQQTAYPPQQQSGYPPQQPGYPPQQPGYPPQQPGYPPQQPGYPPQQPGYPPQQPGYPPQQPGYPPQQPGYPPQQFQQPQYQQPGYPPQQPGYPQPGYPQQHGYPQPGYPPQQPGYPQPGYPQQAAGYPPQQPNFGY